MKKYRMLIIDDDFKVEEETRAKTIEKYFTNEWIIQNSKLSNKDDIIEKLPTEFELLFCATMDEFKEIISTTDIHAFFIDYVLYDPERTQETGDFEEDGFKEVLHTIKDKCSTAPIYIYSSKWTEKLVYKLLEDFNTVFTNKKLPNQLLTFRNFENAINDWHLNQMPPAYNKINNVEKARKQVWDTIATANKHVRFQPSSPSGDIVILHISDLQFGDKNTTQNDVGMWNDMASAIQLYLNRKKLKNVDLVMITGDIAMTGKKAEYKEASEELKTFFKRLWSDDVAAIKDRVVMVPGNHDFDINACVLEYYKAVNKKKERSIDFDSVIEQIQKNKENEQLNVDNEYQRLGLQAFREFAYELTQDEKYICSENLDFIVNKFNNWGLRFICLNSVFKINAKKTNAAAINRESIRKICNEIGNNEELLTIILTHHTSLSAEFLEETEGSNIKNSLNTLRRSANAKIVMGGHRHKNEKEEDSNSDKKTLHTLEAASLRVEDEADHYVRGFGLLTINKSLENAELQYFIFDKEDGEIKLDTSHPYTL